MYWLTDNKQSLKVMWEWTHGTQVDYIMYWLTDNKQSLKVMWEWTHGTFFHFNAHSPISRLAEVRVTKFIMQVEYIKC